MQQIAAKEYNNMKTLNKDLAAIQLNQVIEQLEQLLFCDLVMTYNDYASHNGYELIHDNDEENVNTLFDTPYDAAQAVVYGKYNPSDDYVMLDGYSNAVSFSYHPIQDDNCPIDISELAQWLISEDKLSEYDIAVTTLEDMLASIEDNISDDSVMLNKLGNFLMVEVDNDSYEDNVYDVMTELNNYTYEQIQEIINMLGIDYQ